MFSFFNVRDTEHKSLSTPTHYAKNKMTAIVVFILFIAIQVIASMGALLFSNLDKLGTGFPIDQLSVNPVVVGITMLVAEALLSLGLWLWFFRFEQKVRFKAQARPELLGIFKFHPLKRDLQPHTISWYKGLCIIIYSLIVAFSLSDMMDKLQLVDNSSIKLFDDMLRHPLCWLLLCVVGPLCEELVFRVGILRSLYHNNVPGWAAAAISALAFAVVHGNLTQGIPALVMGFILGMAYLRTGNLRLCLTLHIINNTLAVLLPNTLESATQPWWIVITAFIIFSWCLFHSLTLPKKEEFKKKESE